jgi:hypothetical protein
MYEAGDKGAGAGPAKSGVVEGSAIRFTCQPEDAAEAPILRVHPERNAPP